MKADIKGIWVRVIIAAILLSGLLLLLYKGGAYLNGSRTAGKPAARPSADSGRETAKREGEAGAGDIKRASQLPPLPPIPKAPGEDKLIKDVSGYIAFLDKLGGKGIGEAEAEELAGLLRESLRELRSCGDLARLYMYKYPLCSLAQSLYGSGRADKLLGRDEYGFFYDGQGNWNVGSQERSWSVSGFEKGVYKCYFDPAFNSSADIARSCRALLSIRESNAAEMLKIHGEYAVRNGVSIFPLEPFRQLYTYSDYWGGVRQLEELKEICPEEIFTRPVVWLEIGYGTGKIFGPLTEALAEGSVIYGSDIDGFCKAFASRLLDSGASGWGNIRFIDGEIDSCCMPENSLDVVHPGHIHIGENYGKKDWSIDLNMLNSIKKALKPGGLLLIDDGGVPDLVTLRQVMKIVGFAEVKVYTEPHTDPEHPIFMASFRNRK